MQTGKPGWWWGWPGAVVRVAVGAVVGVATHRWAVAHWGGPERIAAVAMALAGGLALGFLTARR